MKSENLVFDPAFYLKFGVPPFQPLKIVTNMTYREIKFIGLAAILLVIPIIGIVYLLPVNTQEELEFRSEKSKRLKAPFGYPDKFVEYFAAVEGLDEGYAPYPQGSKMEEFRRAMLANAKRGRTTQLDMGGARAWARGGENPCYSG